MKLVIPEAPPAARFGPWVLHEVPYRPGDSFLWRKFKLTHTNAPRRRGQCRAYRLAWNAADLRFGQDKALHDLQRTQPDLFAAVELYLNLNHDEGSLIATPQEIAAEKRRILEVRKQHRKAR